MLAPGARFVVWLSLAALASCSGGAPAGPPMADGGPSRDGARPAPDARGGDDAGPRLDAAGGGDAREAGRARDTGAPDGPASDGASTACSDGSPLAYRKTSCPGTAPATPTSLATALGSASRGAVVSLDGLDEDASPCFPVDVCVPTTAATLLFSDEPESPSTDGVLYADVVGPGHYRAYVYHVNAGSSLRKFPVVLLNQGATTVHAVVGPKGIGGPSSDYVAVGKDAVSAWLRATGTASVDVPPGQRVLLDADLDAVHAANGELAHGILDFTLDGTVKASVVSVLYDEDAVAVTAGLSLLPNTGMHLRGTFAGADLVLETSAPAGASGVTHIDLGGGVTDAALTGHDYVDGTSVTLLGDYGVPYALRVHLAADAAVLVAPQGGPWGGVASLPAGLDGPASVTPLPAKGDSLGSQTEALFAGRFATGSVVDLVLMTAGGSNLPIDVAAVPLP